MERKFGIELEIVGITRDKALRALRAVGIEVASEDYNHHTRNHWKLVSDASVQGGFEVVSPVLFGEEGLEQATTVAQALDDAGATANRSCGFHVHFDASHLSVEDIKTIVHRYADHETEIDAFMPRSRRANHNQYCAPLASFLNRPSFDQATTIERLAQVQGGRYFKVNLQSYQRHGTVEFRQHSGTVNATKVANWVRFLSEFIDECQRIVAGGHSELPALSGVQGQLAGLFAAQRTVLLSTMCDRFSWLPHTARAAVTRLRRAGMDIAPVRVNGQAAYTLRGQVSGDDNLWNGISRSISTFYRHRAAVFATVA